MRDAGRTAMRWGCSRHTQWWRASAATHGGWPWATFPAMGAHMAPIQPSQRGAVAGPHSSPVSLCGAGMGSHRNLEEETPVLEREWVRCRGCSWLARARPGSHQRDVCVPCRRPRICVSLPESQQCQDVRGRPHRPSEMRPPGGQLPSEAEKAPWSRSGVVPCVPRKKHREEKFL